MTTEIDHNPAPVARVVAAIAPLTDTCRCHPPSDRELAVAALDAMRLTESEVATAVYRHFTRPSREQIARELARQRGTHDLEMFDRGLVRRLCLENADAILALFQNGAEHD